MGRFERVQPSDLDSSHRNSGQSPNGQLPRSGWVTAHHQATRPFLTTALGGAIVTPTLQVSTMRQRVWPPPWATEPAGSRAEVQVQEGGGRRWGAWALRAPPTPVRTLCPLAVPCF